MSENLWDEVLARVEGKINRHSFATWFRPTGYLSSDDQTLRISVPNGQFRDWLSKNYLGVLQEALSEIGRPDTRVLFEETLSAEETAGARDGRGPARPRGLHPQPEVHVRELRRRLF